MRKLLALLLCAGLLLGLAACSVSVSNGGESQTDPSASSQIPDASEGDPSDDAEDPGETEEPDDPEEPSSEDDVTTPEDGPDQETEDPAGTEDPSESDPEGSTNPSTGNTGTTKDPSTGNTGTTNPSTGNTGTTNPSTGNTGTTNPSTGNTGTTTEEDPPEESNTTEPTKPSLSPEEAKAIAESLIDHSVSELIAAIGEPNSTDYASSCDGPGDDGELFYDGFTVYTYRENGSEVIVYVE